MAAQQRRFDGFRREFNEERPHEVLGMKCPAELYSSSPRSLPDPVPETTYPGHYEVRRVRPDGEIRMQGRKLFVSQSLARQSVGLEEVDDGLWSLYFGPMLLGRYDRREQTLDLL